MAFLTHTPITWIPAAFAFGEASRLFGPVRGEPQNTLISIFAGYRAWLETVLIASHALFFSPHWRGRVYSKVDVYMLAGFLGNEEVGWYGRSLGHSTT